VADIPVPRKPNEALRSHAPRLLPARLEIARPGTLVAENVVRVHELAALERKAAAADAAGELVSQLLEPGDLVVEVVSPGGGQVSPVPPGRGASLGKPAEGILDALRGMPTAWDALMNAIRRSTSRWYRRWLPAVLVLEIRPSAS
jgi:hypothetical protein